MYICPVCKNSDPKYIGIRNGKPYCRRCISFIGEESPNLYHITPPNKTHAYIKYHLTKEQLRISQAVFDNYQAGNNTLIYAVCGAGKTELVFKVIEEAIKARKRVGFAIPRRDVVIELARRFQYTFKNNIVISVFGGNSELLEGDLVVLTTHQLYRYPSYFDLLIMDEIDAFPYNDNPVLISMFKRAVKGNYVLMSATPSDSILKEFTKPKHCILKLFTRFHMHPISVPKIVLCLKIMKYPILIKNMKKIINEKKPLFVFVATIDECEEVFGIVKHFFKRGERVHSKIEKRNRIIDDFRDKKYDYLITTSVLERGVTVKDLQVVIFNADHKIYNSRALIQISGRVGRVSEAPTGEIIFLGRKKTNEMETAIRKIEEANQCL